MYIHMYVHILCTAFSVIKAACMARTVYRLIHSINCIAVHIYSQMDSLQTSVHPLILIDLISII